MIIGEVKRYLRDNTTSVRVARSIKDIAYHATLAKEELIKELNREPKISEIANRLGLGEYEVSNALDSMKETISIFDPIYNDDGNTIYLSDQLEDKNNKMNNIDEHLAIKSAIKKLKEKEKYIIIERYIVGKTQMELASEIGISQAQISRLEKNGLKNIKKNIN